MTTAADNGRAPQAGRRRDGQDRHRPATTAEKEHRCKPPSRAYPLAQAAEAQEQSESGHAGGKLVLLP
ncbi:zinc-binding dehydrogenase [Streptomyces hypolithicus]